MLAIVDASPLYATADAQDPAHARCLEVLSRRQLRLVVPALVVAELCYLVEQRLGAPVSAAVLRGLSVFEVEHPTAEDFERTAQLVEQYADFPLGATDASVVALAERLDAGTIVTLDRRHFAAVRPSHVPAFELLPD